MNESIDVLVRYLNAIPDKLRILSNHNKRIEIIPNIEMFSFKSLEINLKDAKITVKSLLEVAPRFRGTSILVRFSEGRTVVSGQDLAVRQSLQNFIRNRAHAILEMNVLELAVIEFKVRNEIRTHFRLRTMPQSENDWELLFEFLNSWQALLQQSLLDRGRDFTHVEGQFSRNQSDLKRTVATRESILTSTSMTLARQNPRNEVNIPKWLELVAARSEKCTIRPRKFFMKPITGAFSAMVWTWDPPFILEESCSKSIDLKATGRLRDIDESPPYELSLQVVSNEDIQVKGSNTHIISELMEKKSNLLAASRLHHFGGIIKVSKDETRQITVSMTHGACQHDVEIAYGVIQDIGWTLEMAYYSDRLLTRK